MSLLGSVSLQAASSTWTGAVDGDWMTAGNWSGGVGGGTGTISNTDVVTFSGSLNPTVNVNDAAGRTMQDLLFTGYDTAAFTINNSTLTLGTGSGRLGVSGEVRNSQTINSAVNIRGASTGAFSLINDSLFDGVKLSIGNITGQVVSTYAPRLILGGLGSGEITGSLAAANFAALGLNKISSGTWTMKGGSNYAGTVTLSNGTLRLDYGNAASGTNADYAFASGAILSGSGGAVEFVAKTGANTTTQAFSSLATVANTGITTLKTNLNGGTGLTVTLGGITRSGGTGILFDVADGGQFQTSASVTNGTFHPTVFIRTGTGVDFATKSGSTITGLAATTALNTTAASNSNQQLAGSASIASGTVGMASGYVLRVASTGAGQGITLNSGATLATGNFLYVGDQDYSISGTGTIRNNNTGANGYAILTNYGTGKLTVGSGISLANTTASVGYYGSGLIDVQSASISSGGTQFFTMVRLSATNAINFGATASGVGSGALTIGSGGILEIGASASLTRNVAASGAGTLAWMGDGGFSAFGGDRTVNLASGGGLAWASTAGFVGNGYALILGSDYSDSKLTFQNAIDFGTGNREVRVKDGVSSANVDGELSGVLGGSGGSLSKTGAGTLSVTGSNTYTGGTFITAGSLLVNNTTGSGTGTGAVYVQATAKLGGGGTISGAVFVEGSLAPGNSIGTLSTGALTIANTGSLAVELGRDAGVAVSDQVSVTGSVTLASGADLKLTLYSGLTSPQEGDIFFLVNNDGTDAISGVFSELNGVTTLLTEGSQFFWNSQAWRITYEADFDGGVFTGGNDLAIQAVPEPETWLLVTVAGLVMLFNGRRRRVP